MSFLHPWRLCRRVTRTIKWPKTSWSIKWSTKWQDSSFIVDIHHRNSGPHFGQECGLCFCLLLRSICIQCSCLWRSVIPHLKCAFTYPLTFPTVYISSRFLYFLARFRHAPRFLAGIIKFNGTVIPWTGILVSASFGLLALMTPSNAEEVNFDILLVRTWSSPISRFFTG